MKKNTLLMLLVGVVLVVCLIVIYSFMPATKKPTTTLSATSSQQTNLSTVSTKPNAVLAVADNTGARKLTKPASGPDFNAIVYASAPRTITNPANQPLASGIAADTVLSDPKSDMNRKPIDPKTDPANQVINVNL